MNTKFKVLVALLLGLPFLVSAQNKASKNKAGADTVKKQEVKSAIKPYAEVITEKAKSKAGLFTVHQVDDKFYFELPDMIMNRQILAVTRYSKTPGAANFYGGELANQQTVYWQKGPDNKVFLRASILVSQSKDSTQAIFKAVEVSSLDPIVASFDVKAFSKDKQGVVIDVTDFFKADNQIVSMPPYQKQQAKITSLAADKSYISQINTFPINTEVHTVKTFAVTPTTGFGDPYNRPIPAGVETGFITLELNTSFLLLPAIPMERRRFDERVGYFAGQFTGFQDNEQSVKPVSFAVRWRLEPKDEDVEKFKRGELVEPKKQIVYYIDPATPKKWRKYLIAGVNDWQKAFEQAGFKNAIIAKEWPENDTTMSMEDARYSVIRYLASPVSNAYGPNVHDPRSGEILESHVGWYHNVMKLVHNWYMIQAGAIDKRARKMEFDDELMGDLIRFVSSHEIGHTLGLRHNMGSSSQTPVEKLRDKAWVEANGHTISIMDYARFNYVAQPEDSIGPKGIYPRIGEYDKWAIEWGYKYVNAKDDVEEQKLLFAATTKRLAANPKLWFGGEGSYEDPRSQSEDLGDNAITASNYGIKNLKRVIAGLEDWTREDGDTYYNFNEMYNQLVAQYERYMYHVMRNIAGIYFTNKASTESGNLFVPVERAKQKGATDYLIKQVFVTPEWLIPENVINKLGVRPIERILSLQEDALSSCFSAALLLNVTECAQRSSDPYGLSEYLNDLTNGIWTELGTHKAISIYRRNLQKLYIDKLRLVIKPIDNSSRPAGVPYISEPPANNRDVQSIIRHLLSALKKKIDMAIPQTSDTLSKYHLEDVSVRITRVLSDK
ncbi:zinc-dependent metalloprotease [Mucilaginibacter sp. HC2]|uniref:zinc-dependent metalloprotease n=1 Tax=Mucilaginibacter inviolabilis TaxID=2714892 RepID=UPI00140990BD|nr:zinc-dependent metalloprotease [Mucilaginibacter inviolabilis]NHA03402.1 zinc-dependent metalloprotease [Mucilaginibacter inviolabilis]